MRYKVNEWADRSARTLPARMPGANEHLGAWQSVVFESEIRPFSLSKFQQLISSPLWRENIVRLKGTAWFQHDPLSRFSIQVRAVFNVDACSSSLNCGILSSLI